MIPLFDMHCDTPRYLYDRDQDLANSNGHVSLMKANRFSPYIQVAAIWCTLEDTDRALSVFRGVVDRFDEECAKNGCSLVRSAPEMQRSVQDQIAGRSRAGFVYCIEDCGFITSEDILKEAFDRGVRILIPVWGKTNSLGAAHNAEGGLTLLGREILTKAAKMGIILDISHASTQTANEIMTIAENIGSPVIASHSNSYSFFKHTRNLTEYQVKRLVSLGGIVGHSLCPWHLAKDGNADEYTVLKNIEALISEAGESNVCFGCDLDGTDLPHGFEDISSLENLYKLISSSYSSETANELFFNNAYRKFLQYLK